MQRSTERQTDGTSSESVTAQWYQRNAPALLTYLRLHMPAREDAEDMLVEVFLAALERDYFETLGEEEQRLWLWRVAHNKVADYYRTHQRRQPLSLDELSETTFEDEERAPEQLSLRGEEYAQLHHTIRRLSTPQQEVLRLRFVNGLRCAEIAVLLGKREGAVRMLLSRTLNLLRTLYEKQRGSES